MKETTITVTEAARNFADCVNRVYYQKTTFVLLKNGVPFARLVPEETGRCTGASLAKALDGVRLSSEEAAEWRRDLRHARKVLKTPRNKWS